MHAPDLELYLRPEVVARPRVGPCYAWPHLIPPASAACYLAGRQLPLLESYLRAPQIHAAACRAQSGGRGKFIDVPVARAAEVEGARTQIREAQAPLLALAEAISALDALLLAEARGADLGPLYALVPPALRGYVELVYDRFGAARWRLFEAPLYSSAYFQCAQQSWLLEGLDAEDVRFALVDPLLASPGAAPLALPFAHPGVDLLFSARSQGLRWPELVEALRAPFIDGAGERWSAPALPSTLAACFHPEPPPAPLPPPQTGLRVRYVGHACVLLESPHAAILIDPLVPSPIPGAAPRLSFADLPPRIDAALITHMHADHLHVETLLQLRARIDRVIVPRSRGGTLEDPDAATMLRALGFPRVEELGAFASVALGGGEARIHGLPFVGEHGDLDVSSKLAYRVELGGRSFGFVADVRNLDPQIYVQARARLGPVDTLFLGMECVGAPISWLYGPILHGAPTPADDDSRRLRGSNAGEALSLIEALEAREVYVYAMGLEPWMRFLTGAGAEPDPVAMAASSAVIRSCHQRGVRARRLCGSESWDLP